MQGPFQLLIITGPIIWCHKTFPIASMENKDQHVLMSVTAGTLTLKKMCNKKIRKCVEQSMKIQSFV